MLESDTIPPEVSDEYWTKFTQDKLALRYLPREQQYSEGSFSMIENAYYPALGILRREDLIGTVRNLMGNVSELMSDREYLKRKIDALESKVGMFTPTPEVIVIQEVTENEARDMILKLLDEIGEDIIYPDEISHKLRIDFDMVMKIIKDLKTEGTIEIMK